MKIKVIIEDGDDYTVHTCALGTVNTRWNRVHKVSDEDLAAYRAAVIAAHDERDKMIQSEFRRIQSILCQERDQLIGPDEDKPPLLYGTFSSPNTGDTKVGFRYITDKSGVSQVLIIANDKVRNIFFNFESGEVQNVWGKEGDILSMLKETAGYLETNYPSVPSGTKKQRTFLQPKSA